MKYGFVYIWYDRKHKRYYVGCHWGSEDDGYICSSPWMMQAYRIRPEDFKRRILKNNINNRDEMFVEEHRWLSMIKSYEIKPLNETPRYYNLKVNKDNPWHQYPENIKTIGQKISFRKKGKSTGPCSPEKAQKISDAKKGNKFTDEHKEKLRQSKLGTKHTEEWKQESSKRLKEQWSSGVRTAKSSHTEETKKKMSEAHKGKKLSQEQIQLMKQNNSKKYCIIFVDDKEIIVNGLKQFGIENDIPYVTLRKSLENETPILKYNITKIKAA